MTRTNIYPTAATARATVRMLSTAPIRIDGMTLVFDEKVALYPAKLRVEEDHGVPPASNGRRPRR